MTEAFVDFAFLAGAQNRLRTLEALAGAPSDRSDLCETVGVSRAMIKRILDGLVERGWIERNGAVYRVTPTGEFVAPSTP